MLLKNSPRRLAIFCMISFIALSSCKSQTSGPVNKEGKKTYTHPCGCVLSKEQMIRFCPLDAIEDSVVVCKVGTNNVIGSHRPPMTWTEFILSEYFGGEGMLVSCKTGDTLLPGLRLPVISYKNKQLVVDERLHFDVYDPKDKRWIDYEIPVWRKKVYAIKNELKITADSFIFKPAFQGTEAFAQVSQEYETELKRTNHYMITNTVKRLLSCSMCGDKISEQRLLNTRKDFSDYYNDHPDSEKYLNEYLEFYQAFKANSGKGKQEFYDLTTYLKSINKWK